MKYLITILLAALPFTSPLDAQRQANVGRNTPLELGSRPRQRFQELMEGMGESEKPSPRLFLQLEDLLRKEPALVEAVPSLLRTGNISLEASGPLVFALEEAGSRRAQEALVAIQSDLGQRRNDRLRAIIALGAVRVPREASIESLKRLADDRATPRAVDMSNTALLSLGRAGARLREAGSERYADVCDELVRRLQAAGDPLERAAALKALGNLRERALGFEIAEHLTHASGGVRAAAASALGALHDPTHRELLCRSIPAERFGAVRAYMVHALREIPADERSLQAVHEMVRNERNEEARTAMVEYLLDGFGIYPASKGVLLDRVHNDPSNRVRLAASAALHL